MGNRPDESNFCGGCRHCDCNLQKWSGLLLLLLLRISLFSDGRSSQHRLSFAAVGTGNGLRTTITHRLSHTHLPSHTHSNTLAPSLRHTHSLSLSFTHPHTRMHAYASMPLISIEINKKTYDEILTLLFCCRTQSFFVTSDLLPVRD